MWFCRGPMPSSAVGTSHHKQPGTVPSTNFSSFVIGKSARSVFQGQSLTISREHQHHFKWIGEVWCGTPTQHVNGECIQCSGWNIYMRKQLNMACATFESQCILTFNPLTTKPKLYSSTPQLLLLCFLKASRAGSCSAFELWHSNAFDALVINYSDNCTRTSHVRWGCLFFRLAVLHLYIG